MKQIERLRYRGRERGSALETGAAAVRPFTRTASCDPMIIPLSVGEGDYNAGWAISAMVIRIDGGVRERRKDTGMQIHAGRARYTDREISLS
jgi:hypothetical protein